jgi:hypothetical protein
MTSKERMMIALERGRPDRLPVTIHQWQPFHLARYMGGLDQLQAFKHCGLDASYATWPVEEIGSSHWLIGSEPMSRQGNEQFIRWWVDTPRKRLSAVMGSNEYTCFITEHPCKTMEDCEIYLKYFPDRKLKKQSLQQQYDYVGDAGIVRGFIFMWGQMGPWQDLCELVGTQEAILLASDESDWTSDFLRRVTDRKVEWILRELPGAKFDLIELGGGAASSTVISPEYFERFVLPHERRIVAAVHEAGLKCVYHTCGGMRAILDLIPQTGCDASETLSPPGVGGDLRPEDRILVKQKLGSRVGLIGGLDQGGILTDGKPDDVRREVHALFDTYGAGGGYICSASDHFFHAPVENLKALGEAGRECMY